MTFIKIVRATRDAAMDTTPNGKRVMKVSFAYDIGWGENKKAQFVDGALWGDRGEKIAQYLTKGTQFQVIADDVESYTYQKKSGETVAAIRCKVSDVVLLDKKEHSEAPRTHEYSQPSRAQSTGYAPQQQQRSAQAPQPTDNYDDIDF